VFGCGILFAVHAYLFRFTQDDAYISMRYAKNLVEGRGLVFNPGERVEGYTNFAWTLLLALFHKLGWPVERTAAIVGTAFGIASLGMASRLARALEGRWGPASQCTAALIAGCSAFALWCTGGLETGMFTFLVTAGFERALAPNVSDRGRAMAPLLFAAAAFTRPEGGLIFLIWMCIRIFDWRLDSPAAAWTPPLSLRRDVLIFSIPMILYAAWKIWYFGDLLPNTYYAKAGFGLEYIRRGLAYTKEFFLAYGALGVIPALAIYAAVRGGLRSVEARLLFVWLAVALYVIWIGGDVLYSHRFWLPTLPIGCVLVSRGLVQAIDRARLPISKPVALAGVTLLLVASGLIVNWKAIHQRRELETVFVTNMQNTGRWLKTHFAPGSTIAITTIGAVSYFSELNVIDLLGLTDHEIAHHPKPFPGLTDSWREINYNAESIIARRPDAILFSTGVRPSSAAEKALFCYANFQDTYYPYYFRSTPGRTGIQTLYRVRENAPPVDLSPLAFKSIDFIDEYSEGHLAQNVQGNAREAAKYFENSWELSGRRFRSAREWLGAVLHEMGDPQAKQILLEVVAEDPYALMAMLRLSDDALRRGDLAEAEHWLSRVRDLDPDDSTPWAGLSHVARLRGNSELARQYARESVRRADSIAPNLVLMGGLEAEAGELELARSCFLRALTIDPNFVAAKRGIFFIEEIRAGRRPVFPDSLQLPPETTP
jgi:arabinofuranosyltransferase